MSASGLGGGREARRSRPQLRDEVEGYLRQLIISGGARPGQTLRLDPLATQLDVSITPVREALLLLAHDSWVIQEPHRGFRVAPIQRQDLADAYLVNAFAAAGLAGRAAEARDEDTLALLRDLDDRIRRSSDADEIDRLSGLNAQVHETIYRAARSPRLSAFAATASRFVPRRFWAQVPGWIELNYDAHVPIIEAIGARDSEVAQARMREHILAAGDLLLSYLDAVELFDASSPKPDSAGAAVGVTGRADDAMSA